MSRKRIKLWKKNKKEKPAEAVPEARVEPQEDDTAARDLAEDRTKEASKAKRVVMSTGSFMQRTGIFIGQQAQKTGVTIARGTKVSACATGRFTARRATAVKERWADIREARKCVQELDTDAAILAERLKSALDQKNAIARLEMVKKSSEDTARIASKMLKTLRKEQEYATAPTPSNA